MTAAIFPNVISGWGVGRPIQASWVELPSDGFIGLYLSTETNPTAFITMVPIAGDIPDGGPVELQTPSSLPIGSYEIRAVTNDSSHTVMASAAAFTISTPASPPTKVPVLSLDDTNYVLTDTMTISWANIPQPSTTDLLLIHPITDYRDIREQKFATGESDDNISIEVISNFPVGVELMVTYTRKSGNIYLAHSPIFYRDS